MNNQQSSEMTTTEARTLAFIFLHEEYTMDKLAGLAIFIFGEDRAQEISKTKDLSPKCWPSFTKWASTLG